LETFVTRKITRAATRIKEGLQDKLYLGNLEAKRDWQHAKDAARAMYTILTTDKPDDFVIASGESRSVKDFVEIVFCY
jgi:GDPmannose 4,6-dehydratase